MFAGIFARSRAASAAAAPAARASVSPLTAVRRSWMSKPTPVFARTMASLSKSDLSGYNSKVLSVLGAQWGDEGKGKLVDILAQKYDMVCRFNGGSNAGHTLVVNGKKFAFHLLPCGMLYEDKINVIGNGVVLDIPIMMNELKALDEAGMKYDDRLKISDRAHLLFDAHKIIDGQQEDGKEAGGIGTTKKGIGPCYASKATRNGVRAGDLHDFDRFCKLHTTLIESLQKQYGFEYDIKAEQEKYREFKDRMGHWIIDTQSYVHSARKAGKKILAEGANAALLDLDFGTYPYVTSSATAAGGICTGLGIPPTAIEDNIGIVKAYTTRVGEGPFPTELSCDIGKELGSVGHEFGTTTGRPRRCGWLDVPVVRYSHALNGYSSINITKLDVLSGLKEIKIGTHYKLDGQRLPEGSMPSSLSGLGGVEVEYETWPGWECDISKARVFEDLPVNAQNYLNRIEELVEVPISWIGVGPGRDEMATKGFQA